MGGSVSSFSEHVRTASGGVKATVPEMARLDPSQDLYSHFSNNPMHDGTSPQQTRVRR